MPRAGVPEEGPGTRHRRRMALRGERGRSHMSHSVRSHEHHLPVQCVLHAHGSGEIERVELIRIYDQGCLPILGKKKNIVKANVAVRSYVLGEIG